MTYIGSGPTRFNTADELTVTGDAEFNGNVTFGDNDKAIFGAGSDLQIYHDGSASRIVDSGTGGLTLQADANVVIQNSAGTETKAEFTTDAGVNLYYDNAAKLATTSSGIDVTGTVTADGLTVDGNTTFSGDVTFTGDNYNVVWDKSDNSLEFKDNARARFGDGNDLQIYHNGTYSQILDIGTGDLWIGGDANINIANAALNEYKAQFATDGAVTLYHNNSAKFATTSTGVDITSTATATTFQSNAGGTFTTASGNDLNIVYPDSRSLFIKEGSTTHVTVDNVGNVGIGVTSMTNKLVLPNAAYFAMQDTGGAESLAIRANSSNAMEFLTGGGEKMSIDSSGNLNINQTSTTGGRLNVSNATGTWAATLVDAAENSNYVEFRDSSGNQHGYIQAQGAGLKLNVGSAGGIDFSANANASGMTSELLDDYEEGDFTPTLTPGSGSYNGLTLTGKYTKIGRLVSVQMVLIITASGNASGSATVGNLPFTSITWNRMPNKWRENQATGACGQFVMNQNNTTGFMQNDDGTNIAHTTGRTYLINAVYYSV